MATENLGSLEYFVRHHRKHQQDCHVMSCMSQTDFIILPRTVLLLKKEAIPGQKEDGTERDGEVCHPIAQQHTHSS